MNVKKLIRIEDFAHPVYNKKKKDHLLKVTNLSTFYKIRFRKRLSPFSKKAFFKTARFLRSLKNREKSFALIELQKKQMFKLQRFYSVKPSKDICHPSLFFIFNYVKKMSSFMISFSSSDVEKVSSKAKKKIERLSKSLCLFQKCNRQVRNTSTYFFISLKSKKFKSYCFKGSSISDLCRNSQKVVRGFSSHKVLRCRLISRHQSKSMQYPKGGRQCEEKLDIFWSFTYERSYTIIRPLLTFLRCTVTLACREARLPIYPDLSNLEIRYSRNRIRKQIIPTIKVLLNPKTEKALFQFSELSRMR